MFLRQQVSKVKSSQLVYDDTNQTSNRNYMDTKVNASKAKFQSECFYYFDSAYRARRSETSEDDNESDLRIFSSVRSC